MRSAGYRDGGPAALYSDAAFRRRFAREVAAYRADQAREKLTRAHRLVQEAAELVAPIIPMRTEWTRLARLARMLEHQAVRIAAKREFARLPDRALEFYTDDWRELLARRPANNAKSKEGER